MTKKNVVWPLEPHTKGKHEVLRHYLGAWFPIFGFTSGRILFIDGFAGPGEYAGGERGSPLIALDAFREHKAKFKAEVKFVFIEKIPRRVAHLDRLIEELRPSLPPRCEVQVLKGVFDQTMTAVLDMLDAQRKKLAPAFVMVDPFGVSDTPMSVIERIIRGEKTEVYISFMYEAINRFTASPEFETHLTALFGTKDWRKGLTLEGQAKKEFFYGLYESQLRKAGAKHVLHFDLYEGNRLVYAIFFATRHWLGSDRMKQAIWKVTPGDFAFHGTRSTQLTLGLEEVDYTPLKTALQTRFRGKGWVSIEQVLAFVGSDQTDFHTGQVRKPALVPVEDQGLLKVDPKTRKRKHTYPDGTKLRFLWTPSPRSEKEILAVKRLRRPAVPQEDRSFPPGTVCSPGGPSVPIPQT
jgi:three-Cys-motif partner protein